VRQVWMPKIPTISQRFKWQLCSLWHFYNPMGCDVMTDEYPMVEAFSHLSTDALENMIEWLNDYNHPSAIVLAIVRESARLAVIQKTEATE